MTAPSVEHPVVPGPWRPVKGALDVQSDLPLRVPCDAWFRIAADPSLGLPAVCFEVFWISLGGAHLVCCGGWTLTGGDDGDDRRVLKHERFSMEQVASVTTDLLTGCGPVRMVDGTIRDDLPAVLISSYLSGEAGAFGR